MRIRELRLGLEKHSHRNRVLLLLTKPAFTCSKLTIETIEQCEIYAKLTIKTPERRQWRRCGVLLLTLNRFHTMFWCFHCLLWTYRCRQGAVREMNCWRFFLWAFSERQKVFSAENSTFVRLCCFLRVINSVTFFSPSVS